MMPSDAPKVVYPLASADMVFGVLQLPFSVALAASGQFLGIFTTFLGLVFTLRTIRTVSTRLTDVGVSQLTWGGRVHFSWAETTHVTRSSQSFTLNGNTKRVVVPVEFFDNTAAAISYIESHLPSPLSRI